MITDTTSTRTPTRPSRWIQLAGLAGVIGTILFVAMGLSIFDGPSLGDPAPEMRAWFADNGTEVALFTWAMPGVFGLLFLLFASGLRSVLAPADADTGGMWTRFSFAGAVTSAAAGFVGLSLWGVLAQDTILDVVSDDTLQALAALDTMIFFQIMNWPTAIFLIGASVVIIQSGVLPRWLGWAGVVIALAGVVSGLWIFSGDPNGALGGGLGGVAFIGNRIWVLVAGALMILGRVSAGPSSAR